MSSHSLSEVQLVYAPLPHLNTPERRKKKLHPVGEGLVDHNGANGKLFGGESDDHEDKSNEEAFHPNYIPQCFSLMVQMTNEIFVLLLSFMPVK